MEVNKIYNENCLTTMAKMPDCFIDLTVTSPPYDNLRDYKGFKFPFKHIARHLYRVTKFGGVVVWVVGDATINGSETGTSFKQALFFKECGFRLHDTMIYQCEKPPLTHNRYEQKFEYTFILSKGKPNVFNPILERCIWAGTNNKSATFRHTGTYTQLQHKLGKVNDYKQKGNIWAYDVGMNKSTNDFNAHQHPAIFPEQLAADHIKSWSNEGDLIYDPFTGSGTTLKMAHLLNRNWIGSEISKEYCELAEKRMRPYLQQIKMFV